MPKVKDIPFCEIPNQSALFLDYLSLSPTALRFYRRAPTVENLKHQRLDPSAYPQSRRSEMASILRRQNESYGCDQAAMNQIDLLERQDGVAILTGQQVGLFGGPLYTIYKAVTAIRIAEMLRLCGIPAVPIFWMEGEDHDLAEVTRCTIYHPRAGIQSIDYRSILYGDAHSAPRPVGSLRFPEEIRQAVSDYINIIPDSKWKPEVEFLLNLAYQPGASFSQAFAKLLTRILGGTGLILYDPQDPEAKRWTSSIIRKALQEADAIHDLLAGRDRELQAAGYHSQVRIAENSTALFFLIDGERRSLERRNSGFGIKNSGHTFSLEEMLEAAEQNPEKFSPNVLLRPLVQDYLFPTIAYVGGSSEVAYFAQIEVLYRHFERPMPVLWPRNSLTLIEPEIDSMMERLGIELQDCFLGRQPLTEKAIRNSEFSKALKVMDQLQQRLEDTLADLAPELKSIEEPLAQALETAKRKILHNTQSLRSRIVRLEGRQNSSLTGAIDLFLARCFPNQNLQERELSIHPFFAGYGPSLIAQLLSASDLGKLAHRLLWLEPEN